MTRRVLVTDASRSAAIAIIRSLGLRGLHVTAADSEGRSPGFYSRYASARLRYPSPRTDPEGTLEALLRAAQRHRVELVVPVGDELAFLLSEERDRFDGVCRPCTPVQGRVRGDAGQAGDDRAGP